MNRKFINISDKTFNKQKVIEHSGQDGYGNHLWLCECECGKRNVFTYTRLVKGRTYGCVYCRGRTYHGLISGNHWSNIRRHAKDRGLPILITHEYIWDLFVSQNGKCALTGLDLYFSDGYEQEKNGITTASLDRIDNNHGYIFGNVQWIHKDVNKMKWAFEQKYFIHICKLISEHGRGNA